ncbi:hypothetical protein SS05631_b50200 (plasmid) [Sinorhizobium sp. CCBAU 05631]|nr:hypothetical protein SS05631_b50200 [Sinorhizobium sp. CCBAU 05631]
MRFKDSQCRGHVWHARLSSKLASISAAAVGGSAAQNYHILTAAHIGLRMIWL